MERMSSLRALKSREDHPFLELWKATQPFTPQLKTDRAFSTSDGSREKSDCTAYLDDLGDISEV